MDRKRGRLPPKDIAVKWHNPNPKVLIEAKEQLAREDLLEDYDADSIETERGWLGAAIQIFHSLESLPADRIKALSLIEKVKGWSKNKEAELEKLSDEELVKQLLTYMVPTLKAIDIMAVK